MRISALTLSVLLLCFSSAADSFYDWQGDTAGLSARALLRVYGVALDFPEALPIQDASGLSEVARLIIEGDINSSLSYEANIYQTHIPSELVLSNTARPDIERSSRLEWSFSDNDLSRLAFDRLNIAAHWDRVDLTAGRQAINLATTFYFTPNDFFAPFAAQNFFRVYKSGVDALRAEVRLDDLSQLSVFYVLGYDPDNTTDTGWSSGATSQRDSSLVRLSTVWLDVAWAVIFGQVNQTDVVGGSLQGELFEWLGVRAEGHVADPVTGDDYTEFSIGLEHRWENSFDLRAEYFHHGSGVSRVADYAAALATSQSYYLARNYFAVGTGYEFTPLTNGGVLWIKNLLDQSWQATLYYVYSLSNEAELELNISLPNGDEPVAVPVVPVIPVGSVIQSEFGSAPSTISIEVRSYF